MGRRRKGRDVHGWLVIDKPAGIGSTPVVGRARRSLDARKAGHAGTLDPDATGVLAVAFGEATKTVPFVTDAPKGYRFRVAWGAETHTDDAGGEVVETSDARPGRADVEAALPAFRGDIAQVPPFVSAVKVDGARAYDLARAGERPELAPRPLRVDRLEMVASDEGGAEFVFECGKGGYVRSVARDLGRRLGCLGHVSWLRREWSGPFRAADGVALEALDGDVSDRLLPLEAGLGGVTEVAVDGAGAAKLRNGNAAEARTGAAPGETVWASLDGQAVAVGRYLGGMVHPTKVFVR